MSAADLENFDLLDEKWRTIDEIFEASNVLSVRSFEYNVPNTLIIISTLWKESIGL